MIVDPQRSDAWRDLQPALDAARSGDIVWVRGGVHPSIRIEKSLHLLADPAAVIAFPRTPSAKGGAAIEIRGVERDEVTLAGIAVETGASGEVLPAVRAEGIGRLVLVGCRLSGGSHAPGVALGAFADGAHGIEARGVAEIWLSRCSVEGGNGGAHASTPRGTASGDGGAALFAPDALVLALRSTLRGGAGGELQLLGGPLVRGREDFGGRGGAALHARLLLDVNSKLTGGAGAATIEGRKRAGIAPDGAKVIGTRVAVPDQLEAFAEARDSDHIALVGHQAWGEQSFLACADRLVFDEGLAEDENFPYLDLRTALRIDVVPAAEMPVAPGLIEVLFELEGSALSPTPGLPVLVQQVRQTPSGEACWSNPELLLRWPKLP